MPDEPSARLRASATPDGHPRRGRDRPRRVHDLGRRRARQHAPADAAHVRGARADRAQALAQGHAPVLAGGRRAAAAHPGDDGRARAQPRRRRARAATSRPRSRACTPASRSSSCRRCSAQVRLAEELEEVRRSFRAELAFPTVAAELVRAADVRSPIRSSAAEPMRYGTGSCGEGRTRRRRAGASA